MYAYHGELLNNSYLLPPFYQERPPEKDEAVKKRRESMEPPSTNPGTVPAATFKEPRVSVGGNEVVKVSAL